MINKKYFLPFLALSAFVLIVGCIQAMGNATVSKVPSVVMSQSGNIKISQPKTNSVVSFPFSISGEARVFENQFNYRILDSQKRLVKKGTVTANALDMGQYGPFEIKIKSLTTKDKQITIELFDNSAKDGSEIDTVSLSVKLQ